MTSSANARVRLISAVGLLVLLAAAIAAGARSADSANTGYQDRLVHQGGVVRLGTDWFLHDDGGHQPVGITSLYLTNEGCDLRVVLNNPDGSQIVTTSVDEDAQSGELNITAGVSGGSQAATVRMFRNGEHICIDDPIFDGRLMDLWLYFLVLRP